MTDTHTVAWRRSGVDLHAGDRHEPDARVARPRGAMMPLISSRSSWSRRRVRSLTDVSLVAAPDDRLLREDLDDVALLEVV